MPTSPTAAARLAHLQLSVSRGEVERINLASGATAHSYKWCYNVVMEAGPLPTKIITILKAENVVIGPDGSPYSVSSAAFEGQQLGGTGSFGYVGCPPVYRDSSTRPIATAYRMRIDYVIEGERQTFSVGAEGTFAFRAP